jgi:hypothetical protein
MVNGTTPTLRITPDVNIDSTVFSLVQILARQAARELVAALSDPVVSTVSEPEINSSKTYVSGRVTTT